MRRWIMTMFGAGLLPVAPGTWGSLATVIILYPLLTLAGPHYPAWLTIAIVGVLLFSAACVWLGRYAVAELGSKDPGPFVLDEAAGICLTLIALPPRQGWGLFITLAAVFLSFRLFDVTKPPPARALEKLPQGWGILLDDLAAAVYANLLCQLLLRSGVI